MVVVVVVVLVHCLLLCAPTLLTTTLLLTAGKAEEESGDVDRGEEVQAEEGGRDATPQQAERGAHPERCVTNARLRSRR